MRRYETETESENGFTLVELMVCVLIIGLLLAIALPTFFSAQSRANDRVAQTSLRVAFTNAKALFSDNSSYFPADDAGLSAVERGVAFLDATTTSDDGKAVSVTATTDTTWVAAAYSKSGKCFFLYDSAGDQPTLFLAASDVACTAADGAANVSRFKLNGWS